MAKLGKPIEMSMRPEAAQSRGENVVGLAPPASPGHEGDDLRELMRKLWRRKAVVVGTAVTLTTIAFLVVNQLVPKYTATALVMIDTRENRVIDVEAVMSGLSADIETIRSEISVITSRGLAEKVIKRLKLDQTPDLNPGLRSKSGFEKLRSVVVELLEPRQYLPDEWLTAWEEWTTNVFGGVEPKVLSEAEILDRQRVRMTDAFLKGLSVAPQPQSRVIEISFTSENRRTAVLVANTVADLYIVDQLEAKFEATRRATVWLNDRLTELRRNVEASERAVAELQRTSGLTIESKSAAINAQQISQINTQLILARTARAEVEARLRQIETLVGSAEGIETATEVLESPVIQGLRAQESEVVRKAAELSEIYGERHPRMISIRAEIRDFRNNIRTEVKRIVQSLRNEAAVARVREASLSRSLDQLRNEVGELNRAEVRLGTLKREAKANRLLFETFLARFKETSAQEDIQQPDARIISNADVPEFPSYPDKRTILGMAFVASSLLGVLFAFAIELLDRGFRSTEQIEQTTGVPALGLIPALKGIRKLGKTPENYIMERPTSAYSEAIRTLHTGILMSNVDAPPRIILVVSPLPEEGKTTICLSLARMMALVGQKVALIDADLRRPRAHGAFGVTKSPGLVELLTGKASLDEVIRCDEKSGAHIITSGSSAPNPPDVLGSEQMKNVLTQLSNIYSLVIIDSPPLLAVSDARVLSRIVDKVVFVVRWAVTRREVALTGLKHLLDDGADVAGVILTMVDVRKHARYGYGDSGYYYGHHNKYYTE